MKVDALSRTMRVTDERAARALSEPLLRRLVMSFLGKGRPINEVAASSGMELKRLHHHVTRLCRLGLLKVVEERPRRGRAIKLYQAASDRFFIPFDVAPELLTEALSRELRESIRREHLKSGDGMLLGTDELGLPVMRLLSNSDDPATITELWRILSLELAEAAELRRDLKEVLDRHAARSSGRGKPYLVHAALAPRAASTTKRGQLAPER
jgi:hypothetical protein